jgi:CIC family chloride channel protein
MFVVLGLGLGVVGYGFNFLLFRTQNCFGTLRGIPYKFLGLWVGALIGLLAWFNPNLVGSGDNAVLWAFNSNVLGRELLLVFLARFALTMFCYGSGAIGGIFAPMLAIATLFSLGMARELHLWFPDQLPEPGVFGLVGMGALVAATVRAPLTAILLTMELTGNYSVVLPLLTTCISASITAHGLGAEPIYSVLLARAL